MRPLTEEVSTIRSSAVLSDVIARRPVGPAPRVPPELGVRTLLTLREQMANASTGGRPRNKKGSGLLALFPLSAARSSAPPRPLWR